MVHAARVVRLLSLAVWLGGLIFFAGVLAPTAFSPTVLEKTHNLAVSGTIVGEALGKLHWIGLAAGVLLAGTVILLRLWRALDRRRMGVEIGAVVVMLGLTIYSQFGIIPRMERDRRTVGEIETLPPENEVRQDFDRLHGRSVQVESGVLLAGLVLVLAMGTEETRPEDQHVASATL